MTTQKRKATEDGTGRMNTARLGVQAMNLLLTCAALACVHLFSFVPQQSSLQQAQHMHQEHKESSSQRENPLLNDDRLGGDRTSANYSIKQEEDASQLQQQQQPLASAKTWTLSASITTPAKVDSLESYPLTNFSISRENFTNDDTSPRLWIYVNSWAEGMSAWMNSLTEILILARRFNATVVEPCMSHGALVTCENKTNDTLRIRDVFDLAHLKEYYSRIVSHEEFRQQTVNEQIPFFYGCGFYSVHVSKPTCDRETDGPQFFNMTSIAPLNNAVSLVASGSSSAILELAEYRKGALLLAMNLSLGDVLFVKNSYLRFNDDQFRRVDQLLQGTGLNNRSFSVVHWRADLEDMDYLSCAQDILRMRHVMIKKNKLKKDHAFILMSSLSTNPDNMWKSAKARADEDSSSLSAIPLLLSNGFLKLDDNITQEVESPDISLLAVWDLILAMKADKFATCAKLTCSCSKCNHIGKFAREAVVLRRKANKQSLSCWPS